MKKAPRQIIAFMEKPETYERKAFETAMRNEIEMSSGELSASQELLLGMLVMSLETMLEAHSFILRDGYIFKYNAGEAPSAHIKIRTESLDKIVKILKELDIAKVKKSASAVDELFQTA